MPYTIRIRRDNYSNLSTVTLGVGEIAYDTTNKQLRIGDGSTVFSSLTAIGGGAGGLTSVGLIMPNIFTVSGSPLTANGSITTTLATQTANRVFAGPTTGAAAAPTFRSLVADDIPSLTAIYQPVDATLTALAGLTITTDTLIYGTGTDTFGTGTITTFGRSLVDDADAETARTTLGFKTAVGVATALQAETTIKYVRAAQASLTKGMVVYVSGSNGNNLNVSKAQADAESTSSKTIGLLLQDFTNVGDLGYAVTEGLIEGLNTNGLTPGAAVWLSPTTAGGWTTTKPTAPNHLVFLGWIVKDNASTGSIYVKVNNGQELDELHDVQISSSANNDILQYDNTVSPPVWKNRTLANAGIATSSHTHGNITNAGAINSTANLPLITTTGGVITTGSFGTTANTFCQGNDSRLDLQTITLTGNVTGSGTGSFATTIATGVITPSMFSTAGASSGDVIKFNGTSWALAQDATGSGSGSPGGSDTQVQFNDGGSTFGGDAGFTYVKATDALTVAGSVTTGEVVVTNQGLVKLNEGTGGGTNYVGLKAPSTLANNNEYTFPNAVGSAGQALSIDTVSTNNATLKWTTPNDVYAVFTALDNIAPATNMATLSTLDDLLVLDFDTGTAESAVFTGVLPNNADLTNGLVVVVHWTANNTTSGLTVEWKWEIANLADGNITSKSYDTATVQSKAYGTTTAYTVITTEDTIANADTDGLAAGNAFAIKLTRNVTGTDDMGVDAKFIAMEVRKA